MLVAQRLIEHLDRVVGGAAAGRGDVGDQAGQAQPARIDAEAAGVVVAQQFARDLGDAVHGGRPLDRHLRRALARRRRTEGADRARKEHLAAILARGLEHIVEAAHVDAPSRVRLLFRHRRKQCCEVIDRADVVPSDHFEDLLGLRAVEMLVGALGRTVERHDAQIGSENPLGAVVLPQRRDQLRADLAQRPGDQYPSYAPPRATIPGSS